MRIKVLVGIVFICAAILFLVGTIGICATQPIEEWNRTFGIIGEGRFPIQQTKDGGYIITGVTGAPTHGTGDANVLLMKLKSASLLQISKKPTKTPEERPEVPTEEEKGTPGFEALFALAGVLALSYIMRRKK